MIDQQRHDAILESVTGLPPALERFRETLLANLVMLAEIPAPAFDESRRIEYLLQRFTECGLQSISADQAGNAVGLLPGTGGGKTILVTAHADTPFPATVNHTVTLDTDRVRGPAVADNSLGVAVLATLPTLLDQLDIRLQSDLLLLGTTRSLGRGNLSGLRFFLSHADRPIEAGISVEGVQLGRLNYASLALMAGEIRCVVEDSPEGMPEDKHSAILVMNHVIDRLRAIAQPGDPRCSLVLGMVEGGTAYKTPARSAALRFEIRMESNDSMTEVAERIDAMTDEVSMDLGASVEFEIIARSSAGGLPPDHQLVGEARAVLSALGVEPRAWRYSSAVSCFLDEGVPALTLGISTGRHLNQGSEEVAIRPMFKGVAQLIGILMAVDGGCCDGY